MKGAFYSYNMKADINALAKLLGMRKATHDEYTSIDSCFQFLKHSKGQPKELRMKFYNKISPSNLEWTGKEENKHESESFDQLLSCFFREDWWVYWRRTFPLWVFLIFCFCWRSLREIEVWCVYFKILIKHLKPWIWYQQSITRFHPSNSLMTILRHLQCPYLFLRNINGR